MLKMESDISSLIWSMNEIQRGNFIDFMQTMKNTGLDEKLNDGYSEITCDSIIEAIESSTKFEKEQALIEHAAHKGETTLPKEKWGVHEHHCCKYHGCKYGSQDCPVVLDLIVQIYPCEDCDDERDPNRKFIMRK